MIGTLFSDRPSNNPSFDALGRLPLGHPKASSLKGLLQPRLIRPANQVEGTAVLIQRNAVLDAKALQPLVELSRHAASNSGEIAVHCKRTRFAVQHCITGRRPNRRGSKGRDQLVRHFLELA